VKMLLSKGSRGTKCITVPHFIKTSQSVEEIAIFRFFEMAAVHHIGFVWGLFGQPTKSIFCFYHCVKFGSNRCSSFDNIKV